jgi:hypothetical protein
MRWRLPSGGQSPEEVGRQIAAEVNVLLLPARARQEAEAREQRACRETVNQLRMALLRAVDSYNQEVPGPFHVAILDRGDRLLFNASGRFTLTLIYGMHQLQLEGRGEQTRRLLPMVVDMWRSDGALRFRSVPDSPYFAGPILSEDQFLQSVLRMACDCRFDDQAAS